MSGNEDEDFDGSVSGSEQGEPEDTGELAVVDDDLVPERNDDDDDEGDRATDEEDEPEEDDDELYDTDQPRPEEEAPCDYEIYREMLQGNATDITSHLAGTSRYLTKFEAARVLGIRSTQLSKDAPPLVDPGNSKNTYEIALRELRSGRLPLILRRPLPNGTNVLVRVRDLINRF